uniref:Serpin domain-containing protein n=1 Tax=Tetradesmus obliquus TaxID=3088 RepID=A0A383WKG2_TETOB|eukprot:jgi/Sobl393_1/10376/SZX77733.1
MSGQRVAAFAWQMLERNGEGSADASGHFLSPISLYIALGMALNGAGPGSVTQQQLYRLLHQDTTQQLQQQSTTGRSTADVQQPATDADVELFTTQLAALSNAIKQQQQQQREQGQQEEQDMMTMYPEYQPMGWPLCCCLGGSPVAPDLGVQLIIASAAWTKGVPVHKQFAAQMLQLFQAEVREVCSEQPINEWAARVTNGLIRTAVPPGVKWDVLLTNAVYFKALWQYPFKQWHTTEQEFTLHGGRKVKVDMMTQDFHYHDSRRVRCAETPQYKAVQLPYKWSTISAVIVLPSRQLASRGIAAAAAQLPVSELLGDATWLPVGYDGLELLLPRFTVNSPPKSLKKDLMALGLTAPFDMGAADFSRLSPTPLAIDEVLQSVYISVNEEGTEAAALTAVCELLCGMSKPPRTIRFDRPFLFMLVDDVSSTPLFLGTVSNPSKLPGAMTSY